MDKKSTSNLIENLWDEFVLAKDSFDDEGVLPVAESVLAVAKESEKRRRERSSVILKWGWRAVSLAAACVSVVAILYCRNTAVETILASSDMSKAYYELPDGSSVWLNKGSRISYKGHLDGRRRNVHLYGEAYFDVARDPSRPFKVVTDNMSVTALGTRFSVVAYDNDLVQTFLESGKTLVETAGGESCILSPGQSASLSMADGAFKVVEENVGNHLSWTKDRMVFFNVPLPDIIESLRHWYNVEIDFDAENLGNAGAFTLTVRDETLSEVLESISRMDDAITYSINTEKITIECRR